MSTIEPGFWVAVTLKKDSAPLRVYVGQVQEVDDSGIRLTLIDWLIGTATGWDLFVPWATLEAALVATPEHDVERFGEAGARWQEATKGEAEA